MLVQRPFRTAEARNGPAIVPRSRPGTRSKWHTLRSYELGTHTASSRVTRRCGTTSPVTSRSAETPCQQAAARDTCEGVMLQTGLARTRLNMRENLREWCQD